MTKDTNGSVLQQEHVAYDVPAFERQYLEQRQHRVSDVVEVEIARIRPVTSGG